MSQGELAEEIGIARNTVSEYEVNGMGISMLTALNIVDALDWTFEEWEADAARILANDTWRRAGRRGKREHADDHRS